MRGWIVTPTEWVDVLEEIRLLWPSRPRWPDKAADRCYRQLKGFTVEMVQEAVKDLVGHYPPSPASLEERVAQRAAIEAIEGRYPKVVALPDVDLEASLSHAESIRGKGKSWTEYLEGQS
jgi:hypothetical protein